MKSSKNKILTVILICLFTLSCSTKKIIPDAPDLSNSNYPQIPLSDKSKSSVVLPIEIPLNTILNKLNSSVPKRITFDEVIDCPETPLPQEEHCKINGYVNIGSVNLAGNGRTLSVSTSISGKATMLIKYRIDLLIGSDGRETDKNLHFRGTLNISASPTIDYNWGLKPNLKASINFSEAYVHFGPKISVREETKKKLEPLINKEIAKIEAKIYAENNLRKEIEPLWNELANPIMISDEFNVWNVIRPTQIHYNEIDIKNNIIKLGVGIDFENQTYIGDKPTPKPLAKVPNLSKSKSDKNDFDLNLPLVVKYDELTTAINNNLPEEEIELEDATIKLENVKLFGDDSYLFVSTNFNAKHKLTKASGILYFKAKPKLEGNMLFLEEADFDVKTKNILVKSAEWLMKKKLIDKIKEAASLNLSKELEKVKADINEEIANVQIKDAGTLKGTVNEISIGELKLSKEGIYIHANTKGKINAHINKLEF